LLLIVLVILVAWLDHALNAPELQEALRRQKQTQDPSVSPP
jgi:hypothetical protein